MPARGLTIQSRATFMPVYSLQSAAVQGGERNNVFGADHVGVALEARIYANDPVFTAPAGRNLLIITPVVDVLLSIRSSARGCVPSPNKRLPFPSTTGYVST